MMEAPSAEDHDVFDLCRAEERRQAETIRLTPSENHASKAVLAGVAGEVHALPRNFPAPGISL